MIKRSGAPLLTADKITKTFGRTLALENVSLDVHEGELLVLVGPSGCGKTTLLRIIGGFERPASGSLALDGQSLMEISPEQRNIGIVFQDYALFPHMSVEKNIRYGLKFKHSLSSKERDERVNRFLDLLQIRTLRKRMPHEISAGQQQRVAIARSLVPMPRLLLLDEPFSALDLNLRDGLRRELKRIQRELGITLIHVTHEQEEALALADRVVVMNQGRIEQIGTPMEVYRQPQSSFVASFIGRGNLLSAHVESRSQLKLLNGQPIDVDNLVGKELEPGIAVLLFVRSEAVRLERGQTTISAIPNRTSSGGSSTLKGYIHEVEFLGDRVMAHVNIGGQLVLAKLPADQFERLELSQGAEVSVHFPKDEIQVFPV